MLTLISHHPLAFILALIIGFATGWWIWARRDAVAEPDYDAGEEYDTQPVAAPVAAPAPAPVPAPEPAPIAEPAPQPVAAAVPPADDKPDIAPAFGESDDLTKINGIGPKLCALCNDLGVRRFDQIAAWDAGDVAKVDAHLGSFSGRIGRDNWVEQARLLADGQTDEWQSRFGYKQS